VVRALDLQLEIAGSIPAAALSSATSLASRLRTFVLTSTSHFNVTIKLQMATGECLAHGSLKTDSRVKFLAWTARR